MADTSDSDSEEDSKLREALDTSTLRDNLYGKSETPTCDGGNDGESSSIIGDLKGFKKEGGIRRHSKGSCGPSLRRDKQSQEEVVSDIQVDKCFD